MGRLQLRDLVSVESLASILVGSSLATLLYFLGSLADRKGAAGMFVAVVAALIGIVFAGVALVTSLLSDAYLRLLAESDHGILGFLRPFMLTIGVQVATVLGAVSYVSLASLIPPPVEPWLFGLLAILFAASCLDVVVLMRSVFMHALLRTRFAQVVENERPNPSHKGSSDDRH